MRLRIFVVIILRSFVLTSQEEGRKQSVTTPEPYLDMDIFDYILNTTLPIYDDYSSSPCSQTVRGLSTLGLLITFIIVCVFSMVGNSIVVYVICYMQKRRASTDIYLMHLALADLFFSITIPFWAVSRHSGWIFGNFLCKLMSGLQEATVYSGVFLLACISVDRYFAIVKATRVLSSRRHLVGLVCSVVWLVAGVLSLPVALHRETMQTEDVTGMTICYENLTGESSDHWRVGVRILRHTMGFFLPLMIMAFCYGCTVVTLFHSRNQQKHKAMRVILAVVIAFILCWLPHNITVLIDTLMRGRTFRFETCEVRNRVDLALYVTEVMAFMHCAVNPVLYAFIGHKFRNQLLSSLRKHGVISKRLQRAYMKGSATSTGSLRSRNTSLSL